MCTPRIKNKLLHLFKQSQKVWKDVVCLAFPFELLEDLVLNESGIEIQVGWPFGCIMLSFMFKHAKE